MCSGLNFTKINEKRKELLTSIFARFASADTGKMQSATVAGTGLQGGSSLHIDVKSQKRNK